MWGARRTLKKCRRDAMRESRSRRQRQNVRIKEKYGGQESGEGAYKEGRKHGDKKERWKETKWLPFQGQGGKRSSQQGEASKEASGARKVGFRPFGTRTWPGCRLLTPIRAQRSATRHCVCFFFFLM